MIRSIAKVADHTIQIDTVGPSPTLLSDLTYLDMYSKAWAEANDCVEPMKAASGKENYASRHANGTGPFRVAGYQPGVKLVLEANESWWGERTGNVKQAIFTPIVAETTRVAALLDGQVDMIDPIPQQDVSRIQADPKLQVMVGPEARGDLPRHGPGARRAALRQREGQEPVQGRPRPRGILPRDRPPTRSAKRSCAARRRRRPRS